MLYHFIADERFEDFANLTGQANWAIVFSFISNSIFEQRSDVGRFPVLGNSTFIHRLSKYNPQWSTDFLRDLTYQSWHYLIGPRGLVLSNFSQLQFYICFTYTNIHQFRDTVVLL